MVARQAGQLLPRRREPQPEGRGRPITSGSGCWVSTNTRVGTPPPPCCFLCPLPARPENRKNQTFVCRDSWRNFSFTLRCCSATASGVPAQFLCVFGPNLQKTQFSSCSGPVVVGQVNHALVQVALSTRPNIFEGGGTQALSGPAPA